MFITSNEYTYISFLAAFIHEIGHIIAAKILKIKLKEMKFDFLGARLVVSENTLSYPKEIVLCVFGPLFNFLSAITVYIVSFIYGIEDIKTKFFIFASLSLGILNLLPIRTFDGGRIVESLLCYTLSPSVSKKIVDVLSFTMILLLWCISVYFLLIYSSSLSLFVFSISLFFALFITET
jgi:stage IV sporulation protein FB